MALTLEPRVFSFTVTGIPQPKGSTRSFVPFSWAAQAVAAGKAPRAVTTSDNPQAKGWQQLVREQAQTVAGGTLLVGPVRVAVVFRLPRPASLPRRVVHHLTKPDVDKLARLVLDGMRGVIYADDRAVVELRARKVYAPQASPPGADITVGEAGPPLVAPTALDLFAELP
jgi:Holliday junction resolvase RusA-like endonuclease